MKNKSPIHPLNEDHSIKEVVVSLVVKPIIEDPDSYKVLIGKDGSLHEKYNKFDLLSTMEAQFDVKSMLTKEAKHYVSGFKISSVQDNQNTSHVIQGQTRGKIGLFTFHTLRYNRWSEFIKSVIADARAVASYKEIYTIESAGLLYIDEFYFNAGEYNPELLFRKDCPQLPRGIFDSAVADYALTTQKKCKAGGYVDAVSLKVFNEGGKKTIRMIDNMNFGLKPMLLTSFLEKASPENLFSNFKEANHQLLRETFSDTALEAIGLK